MSYNVSEQCRLKNEYSILYQINDKLLEPALRMRYHLRDQKKNSELGYIFIHPYACIKQIGMEKMRQKTSLLLFWAP